MNNNNNKRVSIQIPSDETTKLHAACREGNLPEVQNFFSTKNGDEEILDSARERYYSNGQSPLHIAVLLDSFDVEAIVDVLLEHDVDVNGTTTADKNTALHLAVEQGVFPRSFKVVLKLLENGADINMRNRYLRTPYDCALGMGYDYLAATLNGSMKPSEAKAFYRSKLSGLYAPYLSQAVLESDEEGIKKNVDIGADPDIINEHGAGAIHYAVTHCNLPVLQVLQLLREGGADVNLQDDEGDTALNLAIKSDRLEDSDLRLKVVTLLLEWGAGQSYTDLDGKNAQELSADRNYRDITSLLNRYGNGHPVPEPPPPPTVEEEVEELQEEESEEDDISVTSGPDVNTPDEDGMYPIHQAVFMDDEEDRKETIDDLLSRGANINSTVTSTGMTALLMAAEQNKPTTVEQLLVAGADPSRKNKLGSTAHYIASMKSYDEVLRVLEKRTSANAQKNWKKARQKTSFCVVS